MLIRNSAACAEATDAAGLTPTAVLMAALTVKL